MKKVITIATAVVLAALLIAGGVFLILKSTPAFASENFAVSKKMLNYYINYKKDEYVEYYTESQGEEYLTTVGLCPEKSLKLQKSCYGGSWYDYFNLEATEELKIALIYCEEAANMKIELSEEEKNAAKSRALLFGNENDNDALELAMILALSEKYLTCFTESIKYDDNILNEYYNEHRQDFDCVDYKRIEIEAIYASDEAGLEETSAAMKTARQKADALVSEINANGFKAAAEKYFAENGLAADETENSVVGYCYEVSTQLGEWAFNTERKQGDVTVFEGRGQYSVYFLEKTAYPYDYAVKRVQKISVNTKENADATSEIYELAEKYAVSDKTEKAFTELAEEISRSSEIIDIRRDEDDTALVSWLYGEALNVGDYKAFRSGNSVFLARYYGEGESYYSAKLLQKYRQSEIEKQTELLKTEFYVE